MARNVPATRTPSGIGSWFGTDPFRQLRSEMDSLLSRFSTDLEGPTPVAGPSLDMAETDDAFELTVDVPGMKPDEIDLEVTDSTLRIRGRHEEAQEDETKTWHRVERHSRSFDRAVTLPSEIDADNVTAEYREGVLEVRAPKAEPDRSRKVEVGS